MVVKQLKTTSSMQGSLFSWIICVFVINLGTFGVADVETVLRKVGENVSMELPKAVPGSFMAVPFQTYIVLTWTKPKTEWSGEMLGYRIRYGENPSSMKSFKVKDPDCTEISLENMKPYTMYTVAISVYNGVGNGQETATEVRTLEGVQPVPSTPRITHVSGNKAHSFYVHWEAPLETNGEVYKYKVKWSDAYGATKARVIAGHLTNPMTAYITHLQPYSRYNVQVSASTRNGEYGPFSKEYPAMTDIAAPSHPRNLSITDISKTTIQLNWEEPKVIYKKVDQYLIKIWDDHGNDFTITTPGSLTQRTVDNLRTDSRYNVKVAGITNAIFRNETPLMGDWSDSITFFTLGEKSESDRDGATECAEGHYNCRHASVKSYMNDEPYCCFDEKQIAHRATVSPVHGGLESSCTCSYASPKSSGGC